MFVLPVCIWTWGQLYMNKFLMQLLHISRVFNNHRLLLSLPSYFHWNYGISTDNIIYFFFQLITFFKVGVIICWMYNFFGCIKNELLVYKLIYFSFNFQKMFISATCFSPCIKIVTWDMTSDSCSIEAALHQTNKMHGLMESSSIPTSLLVNSASFIKQFLHLLALSPLGSALTKI